MTTSGTDLPLSGTRRKARERRISDGAPTLPFLAVTSSQNRTASGGTLDPLRVAGLFAGIGGIELGMHAHAHTTSLLCEIEPAACRVLETRFPGVSLVHDVRDIDALPAVDLVAAGFPCQDLSQAGRTAGIKGSRSGLVGEVFRLLETSSPRWLLLENVPFMLSLDRGRAMHFLTRSLKELGFRWAYRTVDTRAFGLPQRRRRVILLASRTEDPREVLLVDDVGEPEPPAAPSAYGFYWTEGLGGLGWGIDAVPTLKGGSTIGIPSAPGIWIPETGELVTPDIRDAERLQGFPADWTACAVVDTTRKNTPRWKLVGNAVSVPVADWLGGRLRRPEAYVARGDVAMSTRDKWPDAAYSGDDGKPVRAPLSRWPKRVPTQPLREFLEYPTAPLSKRAVEGFYSRMERSTLRFDPQFREAVRAYVERLR